MTYDQKAGPRWIVTPRVRIYTQTAASFYGSLFAAPQTYMSADSRLSPLWSLLGGLGLTYQLNPGLALSLAGTYQVQEGRDRVTPSTSSPRGAGSTTVSAADLNTATLTLGASWKF